MYDQIKIFVRSTGNRATIDEFEDEVNDWLRSKTPNEIDVVNITSTIRERNIAPPSFENLVIVHYKQEKS